MTLTHLPGAPTVRGRAAFLTMAPLALAGLFGLLQPAFAGSAGFARASAPPQEAPAVEPARTERSYPYGSLSFVEGDVWHQRADDFGANEAERNSPFLPGDRIWTRRPGQVELRFAGQVTAWMDEETKLDYVGGDSPHRLGFWTGSLVVLRGEDGQVVVETPGGTLTPQGAGEFRTDLLEDGRTVQFVVIEGVATVTSDAGSVLVSAGQRTISASGTAPAPAEDFQLRDGFLAWTEDRRGLMLAAADLPPDALPEEVREHTRDLHGHGRWHQDHVLGWVWYPAVDSAWAPYRAGHWSHTPFGYTWISYDSWGWAPFHYGRWGHGPYGWYWVPGSVWSPAWVSWAYGPAWVGWTPLNYYGYPVYYYGNPYRYGYHPYDGHAGPPGIAGGGKRRGQVVGQAVARSGRRARGRAVPRAWSFTRRDAMGGRASRTRLAASRLGDAREARVLARGAVLDRGLRERGRNTTGMIRSTRATTRRLANTRPAGGTTRAVGRELASQRIARPLGAARARSRDTVAASRGGAARLATGTRGGVRSDRPVTSSSRSRPAARSRPAPSASAGRPSATRRPSSVRPAPRGRAGAGRPTATRRPSGSAARPSGSRPSASRPSSSGARSRPSGGRPSASRPSSSGARSRPSGGRPSASRPSSSGARSRPSGGRPSASRPSSSGARSRPSGGRPSASRPSSSGARSRPSGGRPSASRPSGSAQSRPSAGSRPSSSRPSASGNRPSSSRRPNS